MRRSAVVRHRPPAAAVRRAPGAAPGLDAPARQESVNCQERPRGQLTTTFVRKRLSSAVPSPAIVPELHVRPAMPEDLAFVARLVLRAAWAGLHDSEKRRVRLAECGQRLRDFLFGVLNANGVALVCEWQGTPIGHSLANGRVFQPLRGTDEAVLVDTYVIDEYRRRGFARVLTAHMESELAMAGAQHLCGSVSGRTADETRSIVSTLSLSGWRATRLRFLGETPVPREGEGL
jgi:GNAT superfamily N-acetyltransferase